MNTELIRVARKAADSWKNKEGYRQAAYIIYALIEEIELEDTKKDDVICVDS